MMVQAGTFMLPYRIWRALEGGLIEEFGSEAKTKVILEEEYGEESIGVFICFCPSYTYT